MTAEDWTAIGAFRGGGPSTEKDVNKEKDQAEIRDFLHIKKKNFHII